MISVNDEKKRGLRAGAFGFLEKPVEREGLMRALERSKEFITRPVRNLLLVEDDENQRASITALLNEEDVKIFGSYGFGRAGSPDRRPLRLRDHRSWPTRYRRVPS